jgi:hypothetical protein
MVAATDAKDLIKAARRRLRERTDDGAGEVS